MTIIIIILADPHAATASTEGQQVTWLTFKELAISFSASGSCNSPELPKSLSMCQACIQA